MNSNFDWEPPTAGLPLGDASLAPDIVRQRLAAPARRFPLRWPW
jgi:hypothetical protein